MPWGDGKQFWVGRHERHGLIVVERPDAQVGETIPVYFVEQDRVAQCSRGVMRQHSRDDGVPEEVTQSAILAYKALITRELEARRRELEKRNQEFQARYGRRFAGVRVRPRSNALPARSTHCWACYKTLDSTIDLECVDCSWILCACGACGCAYSGPSR